jgi:DNA-binding GntR family transcriptional regulator
LKSLPKSSRVDDAYDLLKADILENRLPPGLQATEPEIAVRLGMSRTPVREALVRLQNEGLIELVPRRGIRVVPIAPKDMHDIYQLLTVLEPEAAADVARRGMNRAELEALETATADMERALEHGDLDGWAAADDRFHRTLLSYSTNERLTAFLNTLFDQAHRARMITLRLRETPTKSTVEHRDILQAILSGDAQKTREVFRRHRERSAAELVRILENTRLSHL